MIVALLVLAALTVRVVLTTVPRTETHRGTLTPTLTHVRFLEDEAA